MTLHSCIWHADSAQKMGHAYSMLVPSNQHRGRVTGKVISQRCQSNINHDDALNTAVLFIALVWACHY